MKEVLGLQSLRGNREAEVREMAGRAGLGAVVYSLLGLAGLGLMFWLLLGVSHWLLRGMALPLMGGVVLCLETGLRDGKRYRRLAREVRRLSDQPE